MHLHYFPVYTDRAGNVELAVSIRAIQDDCWDSFPMKALSGIDQTGPAAQFLIRRKEGRRCDYVAAGW